MPDITPLELQVRPESTMLYPSVFNRVRMSDRDGEFVILRVDHLACVVDLCPTLGHKAIETNVPFNRLSESSSFDSNSGCESAVTQTVLDRSSSNLRASRKVICASQAACAELRHMFHATFEMIRMTQRRIIESDQLIDRAQFLPPPRVAKARKPLDLP